MAADRLTVVGRSVPRLDARDKVTGAARYVSDLVLPGMAHAKLWRSPVAHARIIRVETERAAAAPGVLAVLTVADLPVKRLYYGPAYRDQPILAHEVIRYAGEPVVAVVADNEAHAEAALALVDVRYDELPAATSAEEALAPGAPLIHPKLDRAGHFRDLSGLRPGRWPPCRSSSRSSEAPSAASATRRSSRSPPRSPRRCASRFASPSRSRRAPGRSRATRSPCAFGRRSGATARCWPATARWCSTPGPTPTSGLAWRPRPDTGRRDPTGSRVSGSTRSVSTPTTSPPAPIVATGFPRPRGPTSPRWT